MSSNVLREYLISVGFRIDETKVNGFNKTVVGLDAVVSRLGKGLAAAGASAVAMVTQFSYQMEKLYYASHRANTTVGNLQALEYAGKSLGLGAGTMAGAVENMARAMRSNPGISAMIESLTGKPTEGRDTADVLMDIVDALSKMEPYVAQQYGSMLGLDADTLNVLVRHKEELRTLADQRKGMADAAGVDADKAAQAAKYYAQTLREIGEQLGLLKDAAAVALLPIFTTLADKLRDVVSSLTSIFTDAGRQGWWNQIKGVSQEVAKSWAEIGKETKGSGAKGITDLAKRLWEGVTGNTGGGVVVSAATKTSVPVSQTASQQLFARLEKQYGLPAGWLDRQWATESGRGKNMLSKAGARGHFQFMPKTQKEYGLKDPNDLEESATAAAKKVAHLLKYYHGDTRLAAAAYNWGEGNLDRYGLGKAPKETRDYMDKVAGSPQISQTNNITVTGVSDPAAAARLTVQQLETVNSDLTRNMKGAVR